MALIKDFDPWDDPLCTCPAKYSLNPYTGCEYSCVYCYISSYVPRAFESRPKENLMPRVKKDLEKIHLDRIISMSNSSDPYPTIEAKLRLTRICLELFSQENCKVQLITKSDLVKRDIDVLSKIQSVVSLTITTLDEKLAAKLEPGAPNPKQRLDAMKKLSNAGIPVTLRLDPLIPFLNIDEIEKIVDVSASNGAEHVTSSTFKPRIDSWQRMYRVFPIASEKMKQLYFK